MKPGESKTDAFSRRNFIKSAAVASTAVAVAGTVAGAQAQTAKPDAGADKLLRCAIIGVGKQGRILLRDALKIPGLHFVAICDIWEKYSQRYAASKIKRANRRIKGLPKDQIKPRKYVDYKQMLAQEKNLDAVIIATPDFVHAEHTIACLEKGIHVYCEKEMSNSLTGAADMVRAMRKSGKLLQIGHQRRSNPVYLGALEALRQDKICGRITNCYAQWNRAAHKLATPSKKYPIPQALLQKFGYADITQFANWRWYQKYSAGPIADLGSHQIDIFGWFLGTHASSLLASGNKNYYKDRQWYEDVMAIYKYQAPAGAVQAFYQVLNTNSFGDYFERFLGDRGTLTISEDVRNCYFAPEQNAPMPGYIKALKMQKIKGVDAYNLVDIITARDPKMGKRIGQLQSLGGEKSIHGLHLENFFSAVRGRAKLNCPADVAYPTAVEVLNVLPAIASGKMHSFKESDFVVK